MIERVGEVWYLDTLLHPAPARYASPWRSLSVAFLSAYFPYVGPETGVRCHVREGSARIHWKLIGEIGETRVPGMTGLRKCPRQD